MAQTLQQFIENKVDRGDNNFNEIMLSPIKKYIDETDFDILLILSRIDEFAKNLKRF